MTIDRFIRWALFCAGIITSIFAGYMFYIDNIAAGAAWLAVSVGFLCFSTRITHEGSDDENTSQNSNPEQDNKDLHDMAMLIASIAVSSLKNIGRTVPPSSKEIQDMESKLNDFLDAMPIEKSERAELNEEFNRLKNRTLRNESGRAILRSSRL